VEFNLNGIPNNTDHVSDFRGKDGGIVELNAVSLADTVFSIAREAIKIKLHPYNNKREGAFYLSKSMKPLTGSLKTCGT
jgi:hypothetical protein